MTRVSRQVSENLSLELARQCLIVNGESPPHTLFISSWHICAVLQNAWHMGVSFERFSSTHLDMESGVSRHGRKQNDLISAPHVSLTAGEGAAAIATWNDMERLAATDIRTRRCLIRRAYGSFAIAYPGEACHGSALI
jgi:hypothetical protein